MSSDPVGGNILFPPALSRADLIATVLQATELTPNEFEVFLPNEEGLPRFSAEGIPVRTEQPPERALALLAQEESGIIKGRVSKIAETYWFEPPLASYPNVLLWIGNRAMRYYEQPQGVESFVERWLHLCEQGHAIFGYVSNFGFLFYRDFLENEMLPAVQKKDLDYFLSTNMTQVLWLIYLGPEMAEKWRANNAPLPSPCLLSQDLP